MTRNWCPACEEICHGHSRICTTCGTTLEQRNNNASSASSSNSVAAATTRRQEEQIQQLMMRAASEGGGGEEQAFLLQAAAAAAAQGANGGDAAAMNDTTMWESIPPQLLDPQQAQSNQRYRGTSKKTLSQLPRIELTAQSSFFYESALTLVDDNKVVLEMEAISAEFGPEQSEPLNLSNAAILVPPTPRTGKNGKLSYRLPTYNNNDNNTEQTKQPLILYVERGDGVTFVQKVILALKTIQNDSNATNFQVRAIVIGNNIPSPWPYIMKDSKNEAKQHGGIHIPVVMIPQQGAQTLCSLASKTTPCANLQMTSSRDKKECVVCRDDFEIGQTILQLPTCRHAFHEACATMWLTKHNTCPTCRLELPTDDEEYEQERRRLQRTHANSSNNANNRDENWNQYYG